MGFGRIGGWLTDSTYIHRNKDGREKDYWIYVPFPFSFFICKPKKKLEIEREKTNFKEYLKWFSRNWLFIGGCHFSSS